MAKNKLQRWAEMETFPEVIQGSSKEWMERDHELKGRWNTHFFEKSQPIVLELGCGKGEYTVGLAKKFPEKNFLGMDLKGHRIYVGAKEVHENKIRNAGFVRTRVDFSTSFFAENEIDEIWLTFSDPQRRKGKDNKRLSSPRFLERYAKFLKPNGIIHLKSDSDLLYEYTKDVCSHYGLKVLEDSNDLYGTDFSRYDADTQSILDIRTHYESIWLAKDKKIKYLKFSLPANFVENKKIEIVGNPELAELEKFYINKL